MKKIVSVALFLVILVVSQNGFAVNRFDFSVFNNGKFVIEKDDMNGSARYYPNTDNGGQIVYMSQDGNIDVYGWMNITKVESELFPVMMCFNIIYTGKDWVFADKVIIRDGDTRYIFPVDRKTSIKNGKVSEVYTIVFSDKSLKLIENLHDKDFPFAKYRLEGKTDVDGYIYFNDDSIKLLYDSYEAAGGLEQNFAMIRLAYPVEIKVDE